MLRSIGRFAVGACPVAGVTSVSGLGRGLFVHFFREFVRGGREGLHGRFDGLHVVSLHGFLHAVDRFLNFGFLFLGDLVSVFLEILFRSIDQGIGLIADFDGFAAFFILFGMRLGVFHQLLDFFLAQAARSRDLDGLFFLRGHVLGRNVDDPVRVDVERDFDLRHASRGRGDSHQIELAEQFIVIGHFTFALKDPNGHGGLAVCGRGENLALLGRNRGVAVDQAREDAAQCFNAQGQGSHVQQQHVLDVALEDAALDGGSDCHDFVGIHAFMGFLAEEGFHPFDDFGHPCHPADEYHFIDLAGGNAGIGQGFFTGFDGAGDQVIHELFQFGPGEFEHQVFGPAGIGGDKGQIDFRFLGR